jgi:hypothetical protein
MSMPWLALECSIVLIISSVSTVAQGGTSEAVGPAAEYASLTTGCQGGNLEPGIAVTVYGAPAGNVVGYETVSGPVPPNHTPVSNQLFAASQFHPGDPVPMSLVHVEAGQSYTVSFTWTDGSGVAHSMSPTTFLAPAGCPGTQSTTVSPFPQLVYAGMLPTASGQGYYLLSNTGLVPTFSRLSCDNGGGYGSGNDLSNTLLNAPVVGMARGPTNPCGGTDGYWIVTADGGVFTFGAFMLFYGSAGSLHLNSPIVGIASTSSGDGYWLVGADGGIFNYGDAGFFGSAASLKLNSPIVGMAPTPDDQGYYLVAADGGVFAYGDARFQGSMSGSQLNQPVIGMGVDNASGGYWLAAADGGIFTFDAPYLGGTGGIRLNQPIVSFAPAPSASGYWLMGADGGIFAYNAPFLGSGVVSQNTVP